MITLKKIGFSLLVASTIALVGCSNNKNIADLSQVELHEIVGNLPGTEAQLFQQYLLRNTLAQSLGSPEEQEKAKNFNKVSVKKAIQLEKEYQEKKQKK
jgi:hypothetical protein